MPAPQSSFAEAALVDQRQVGLISIDSSGAIVESNDRAREILDGDSALRADDGRLVAQRPEDVEVLEDLLEVALGGEDNCGTSNRQSLGAWPDQRPLTVYVKRVATGDADVAAVVVMVDPWHATRLSPEQVAQSLRLTRAESRVAVALAEGMTTQKIAEDTDRKLVTVRWLVQRALEKTYCRRQADLVRLVLTSSHLPIAQWE
ncbi:MAG: hypothetical protein OXG74_02805 [Acidobacteria bacterium]|nr:hypothetical protein [Acidobacteriota bacterium]